MRVAVRVAVRLAAAYSNSCTWRRSGCAGHAGVVADNCHSSPRRDGGVPCGVDGDVYGPSRVTGDHHNLASCVGEGGLCPVACQDGFGGLTVAASHKLHR